MGWLIVSLILVVLSVVLIHLDMERDWNSEAASMGGAFVGIMSFIAAVILSICMLEAKSDGETTVLDYNNLIELTSDLSVPSEAIMERTIDMNETIIRHQVKSERFMTRGLYSKDVAALPLLEVPETMRK